MKRIYYPTKKKTILLVDDNQAVAHLYREAFQSNGFNLEIAVDGFSAMQRLKTDPVDLVILDLCLPGTNGADFLTKVRANIPPPTLPVIAFSNTHLGNLARAALEAGATKCVPKFGSTPARMLELVRELLTPAHDGASPETVVGDARGPLATQPVPEFQERLVATLRGNAPRALADLRTHYQVFARAEKEESLRAELCEMHRQVRTLAGSAGLLGFRKIAQMANALEALLIELQGKPKKITPSSTRTVAQAIDTLAALFDHVAKPQPELLVPPRILVVDDEVISREAICSALAKADLTATSLDGSLAAQRLLQQEQFDLIFLDVEMPGQNGLDLCTNIREMPANRSTPVVFVTSHADFGSQAQSTLSGGNDFIAKPFLLVELAVKALTLLFRAGQRPPAAAMVPAPAAAASGLELDLPAGKILADVPGKLLTA